VVWAIFRRTGRETNATQDRIPRGWRNRNRWTALPSVPLVSLSGSEQPTKTRGLKLYRELILNNFVSCTLEATWTHCDLVEQIAKQSKKPIPIDSLPNDLN
jgi:hypothetical protein